MLGLVFGVLGGLTAVVLFVVIRGRTFADDAVLIYAGFMALGWLMIPLLLFSSDNSIDPLRFSLLPLTPHQLVRGQLAAGVVGGPTVFGVLSLLAAGYAISDSAVTAVLGMVAALLTLLLCTVASRALTTSFGSALRSRRGRDFGLVAAALLGASFYPVQLGLQAYLSRTGGEGVRSVADLIAWTPAGWPFAAVLDATAGRWGLTALKLAGTAAVVALLLGIWARAVRRTLEAPAVSGGASRSRGSDLVPWWVRPVVVRGPTGAVIAKELRYWWRDPRRRAAAFTSLLIGAGLVIGPSLAGTGGVGRQFAFVGLGPAFFATMNNANIFGLDGTSIWTDVSVGRIARALVRGRQAALALFAVPAMLVLTVVGTLVAGASPAVGAAAFGLCAAALGCGLAVTSVMSVGAPYAVPDNPSNPFATGTGAGCSTLLYQSLGFMGEIVLVVPIAVISLWGVLGDVTALMLAAFVLGPVWGIGAAALGSVVAAGIWDRRAAEVLVAVTPRNT